MTRIDKYLKKLEGQRRSKPVTREMWQNWLAHPVTEIFFLSLDIRHAQLLTTKPASEDLFWMGHHDGLVGMAGEIINYEPHELTDEGEKDE